MKDKTYNKHKAIEEVNSSRFYLSRYIKDLSDNSQMASDRRVRYLEYTRSTISRAIKYLSNIAL